MIGKKLVKFKVKKICFMNIHLKGTYMAKKCPSANREIFI